MSKIDQAFIRAFASETPAPTVTRAWPPTAQPRVDSAVADTTDDGTDEHVLRTPHFATTPPVDAREETATLQQGTIRRDVATPSIPPRGKTAQSERRPLSSFSTPEPTADHSFRPVFEVDAFRWPQVTTDLLEQNSKLLIPVAEQLLTASEEGRSLIGIAGTRENVGASTILLCLARLLASVEKTVALVDADFSKHSLASDLGLEIESGWEQVLTGHVPLAEGVIHSIADNVSLLPLAGTTLRALDVVSSIQASVSAGVLRYHYDIVLFDLGTASEQLQFRVAQRVLELCRIDASIIVADSCVSDGTDSRDVDQLLSLLGKGCLGLIGNDAIG